MISITVDIFCDYCECWDHLFVINVNNSMRFLRNAKREAFIKGYHFVLSERKWCCPKCWEIPKEKYICSRCKKEKLLSGMKVDKRKRGFTGSWCIDCTNEDQRDRNRRKRRERNIK